MYGFRSKLINMYKVINKYRYRYKYKYKYK